RFENAPYPHSRHPRPPHEQQPHRAHSRLGLRPRRAHDRDLLPAVPSPVRPELRGGSIRPAALLVLPPVPAAGASANEEIRGSGLMAMTCLAISTVRTG